MLVSKVEEPEARAWYLSQAVEHGWSRAILISHIETRLHERQGRALTNFGVTLPKPESDLLQQTLKDSYIFDFLALGSDARERDLEAGLLDHIQRFLMELGVGFAFVGRQVHLEVGGQDFYLDLLFYHLKLRSFVVIELKAKPFEPEFTGKLNFYLSAVDDLMRHPSDNPTIGILLCKGKNRVQVEYALRGLNEPMGVAEWQTKLVETLPEAWEGSLPSIEELEAELLDD